MAEPAVVPVKLDVYDISLQGIKVEDVKKDITQKIGNLSGDINNILSNVDTSVFTERMNTTFTSVEKRIVQTMNAQREFNKVLAQVATSDPTYASYVADVEQLKKSIQVLTSTVESFEDSNGNVRSDVSNNASLFATYTARCNELQQAYTDLQAAQGKLEDPSKFVKLDNLNATQLEAVVTAYEKIKASIVATDTAADKFNTTSSESKMTNEYQQYQVEADKLSEKLVKLNEKAQKMGQIGATDKQWETLRYDIDTAQSGIDNAVKKMRSLVASGKGFRFKYDTDDVKEARSEINKLNREQKKLADSSRTIADKHESPYSEQYKEALKQLEKYEQAAEKLKDKANIQTDTGASEGQLQKTQAEAVQLDNKIQELLDKMRELIESGDAFKLDTGNASQELQSVDVAGERLHNILSNIGGKSNIIQRLGSKFKELGNNASTTHPILSGIAQVAGSLIRGFGSIGKVAKEFGNKVKSAATKAKDALSKIVGKLKSVVSGFKNAISKLNIFKKSGRGMNGSFDKSFKKLSKNILQFGLGFRSMYFLIKRLRKIFTDAMEDIGNQFPDFGSQINSLKQSFTALKGSIGTAFQPLASAVIPVLTKIMDYATNVLEVLGKFNAALTGQNFIYKANAKAIDATTDAKKKSNAEDKKQLASYDKLEVISKDKDTGSDSSSDKDSGVTYTKESIDGAVSDFAQAIKDAWNNADFTDIGTTVGTKLSSTLDGVQDFITKLDANSVKVGKSLATFINGFTAVDGLGAKLGSAFTGLINAGIHGISSFVSNVDFASVGTFIGSGINSVLTTLDLGDVGTTIANSLNGIGTTIINAVNAIDFKTAATNLATGLNNLIKGWDPTTASTALSNSVKGVFTYISTAIQTVDWKALGTQLATFIKTIDWSGISDSVFEAIGSAFGAVGSFLVGLFEDAVNSLVNWWNDVAFENGEFTIEGLFNGILTALGDVATWIKEHIFDPIWTGIKNVFGIHSPSTKMEEIGGYLIEGLKNGVSNIWDSIKSAFTTLLSDLLGWFTNNQVDFESAWTAFTSIIKPISASISAVITTVGSAFNKAWNGLVSIVKPKSAKMSAKVSTDPKKFKTTWTPISSIIKNITAKMSAKRNTDPKKFKTTWNPISNIIKNKTALMSAKRNTDPKKFKTTWTPISSLIKNLTAYMYARVATRWTDVQNTWNTLIGHFKDISVSIGLKFSAAADDIKGWINSHIIDKVNLKLANIPILKDHPIPRLAKGAVIPPNREFLAVLGDQSRGTNIEAPLDTIKQALAEVIAEIGDMSSHEPIELKLDGKVVAKVVWDESKKLYKQTGKSYI